MSERFDPINAERLELDTLLEKGTYFTVPKRSLLRRFGKPERSFFIKQPFLGTLDYLSREYIRMHIDEEKLKADPIGQSRKLFEDNPYRCARVIAISVLNSQWKIRLFAGLLARYLLWHITPAKLFKLVILINQISNLGDFTNSIRFLSTNRTTAPALMENPEGLRD